MGTRKTSDSDEPSDSSYLINLTPSNITAGFCNSYLKLIYLKTEVFIYFNTYVTKVDPLILRIGAKQECIVRHERIMPNGRIRNSVRFSIINSEWPAVKKFLEGKISDR
jgi:hypothetical protein